MTAFREVDLLIRRQLFWKLKKAWDEKDYDLARANLRIKALEA